MEWVSAWCPGKATDGPRKEQEQCRRVEIDTECRALKSKQTRRRERLKLKLGGKWLVGAGTTTQANVLRLTAPSDWDWDWAWVGSKASNPSPGRTQTAEQSSNPWHLCRGCVAGAALVMACACGCRWGIDGVQHPGFGRQKGGVSRCVLLNPGLFLNQPLVDERMRQGEARANGKDRMDSLLVNRGHQYSTAHRSRGKQSVCAAFAAVTVKSSRARDVPLSVPAGRARRYTGGAVGPCAAGRRPSLFWSALSIRTIFGFEAPDRKTIITFHSTLFTQQPD